jgi:chromosome segregation ATPase
MVAGADLSTFVKWAAVLGGVVGIVALAYSRRQTQATIRDDARDEAFQLAEVRRQTIVDLTSRVDALREHMIVTEKRYADQVAELEKRYAVDIADLKATIKQIREEYADAQRTIAASVRLALRNVRADLEQEPPDVTSALHDLRDMLDGDQPTKIDVEHVAVMPTPSPTGGGPS